MGSEMCIRDRGASGIIDRQALYLIKNNWMLWIALVTGSTPVLHRLGQIVLYDEESPQARLSVILYIGMFLLCVAYLVTETYNPFLYFRF